MFAGSTKTNHFLFEIFVCASHLKIKHFELPPAYRIEHMKRKLTEMHT